MSLFGCSDTLAEIIEEETGGDMLRAIKKLGPSRVQFVNGKAPAWGAGKGKAAEDMPTTWALDGRQHATVGEICRAAGMAPPAKERGQVRETADAG